jgi:hypothetical protein
MRVTALGNDSWMLDRVAIRVPLPSTMMPGSAGTENSTTDLILSSFNASVDSALYSNHTKFWLDGDEEAPSQLVYDIPATTTAQVMEDCKTRDESRAVAFGYVTSPSGTKCVFGVDERDEGKHCIYDDGLYGSFGWCYTAEDMGSFGSCDEACPLWGPSKIIARKIDEVLHRLDNVTQQVKDMTQGEGHDTAPPPPPTTAVNHTTTGVNTTTTTTIVNTTTVNTTPVPTSSEPVPPHHHRHLTLVPIIPVVL